MLFRMETKYIRVWALLNGMKVCTITEGCQNVGNFGRHITVPVDTPLNDYGLPIRKMHAAKLAKFKHVHGAEVVAHFGLGIGLGLVVIGRGVAGYVDTDGIDEVVLFMECSVVAR